jgi:CheY-like chemotaxis protein
MPKIFILDDDPISNELNKIIFSMMGLKEITIKTTGTDAIQYLEQCNADKDFPDAMFIDLNLPGMNGFEFIEEYEKRYMKYNPGPRIIMLTNSILEDDRIRAMQFGSVLDFMSKPLNKNKIREILQKVNVTI